MLRLLILLAHIQCYRSDIRDNGRHISNRRRRSLAHSPMIGTHCHHLCDPGCIGPIARDQHVDRSPPA